MMFNKLENFVSGVASGVQKGINEMAEEARNERKTAGKTVNITVEEYMKLRDRVTNLEKQMETAMDLIAMMQKQVLSGIFDDEEEEPEEPQEEST